MALVVQSTAARQGNANTALYSLASKQAAGGAAVFHDITTGNNSVPGLTGFTATSGYDKATGLGSVNAAVLVGHWADASAPPAFHATAWVSSISVKAGASVTVSYNVTVSGGFNAAVGFSLTGLPAGLSATWTPATIAAPGSGSGTLKLTAQTITKAGSYSTTISAASGAVKQQVPLTVTVTH
jgi:hypothetical protein